MVSRVSLFLTERRWLEHFENRRRERFWVFFNSEVALGYWSGTVLVEGLAGKTLFWLGVASFFLLCAIKLDIKGKSNSLLLPRGRLGSELPLFPHIYSIALNFIS